MRKRIPAVLLSFLGTLALSTNAAASTTAAQQPKTMDEVLDRIIANENRLYQNINKYQPLVETYIQNLKPDKELGFVPAGDKYFLGRADFSKGVQLVSLSDAQGKGKKIFSSVGNFFSLDTARQRRYLPYAPRFIQREYRSRAVSRPELR